MIGYLLGMIRNRAEPTIAREPLLEVRTDMRELEALQADLRELRDELTRAKPERDTRTPAVPTSDDDARLIAMLERLEAAIARLDGGAGRPPPNGLEIGLLARLDREVSLLMPGVVGEDGQEALGTWMEQRSKELTAQHLLWTLDEVITTYGRPTQVDSDFDRIALHYDVRKLAEDFTVDVSFVTYSLRVIKVHVFSH